LGDYKHILGDKGVLERKKKIPKTE